MLLTVITLSLLCQVEPGIPERTDKYTRVMKALRERGSAAGEEAVYAEGEDNLYQFGYDMATIEGRLDDAIEYFVRMARHKDDLVYYFGKAWVHWQKQEVGYAKSDAIKLINSDASDLIKARSYYLLGNIQMQNNEIDDAIESAQETERLYRHLGKNGGLYLAYILKAAIEIKRGEFEEGKAAIDEAESYNSKIKLPYPKARSHELYAEIYFQKHNYEQAIHYSNLSKDSYFRNGQDQDAWGMTTRIGLCYALLGEYERAHTISLEVDAVAKGKKFDRIRIYNYITIMYLDRCKGYDYSVRRKEVTNWIKHQKTKSPLKGLLGFVEKAGCK